MHQYYPSTLPLMNDVISDYTQNPFGGVNECYGDLSPTITAFFDPHLSAIPILLGTS
jgi:hypothetical protein